jgi:hypothetical protein
MTYNWDQKETIDDRKIILHYKSKKAGIRSKEMQRQMQ